ADADHDVAHGGSFVLHALRGLGFGKIPLSMLMPLGFVSFGFSGLVGSMLFGGLGANTGVFPEMMIFPVLGLAATGSILFLRVVAGLFRKIVPDGKTASDRWDLLGLVGKVKTTKIDAEFGQALVKDSFGNELEVACIALDAERTAKYGEEVVL